MTEARLCPQCHQKLLPDAPEGLCPQCLFNHAFFALDREPSAEHPASTTGQPQTFTPPEVAELAELFPQLEILSLLGQGGMGAVYRARQIKLDRLVALKILPPETARDPAFAERFTREARALARLGHPHIVAVHDFGEIHGLYYFLMEFVDGVNLRQLMHEGKISPAQALELVQQICDALQYAHEQGVVHRDIKPENILVDRRGQVKIADFGLAKLLEQGKPAFALTGSQQVMGTPHYMAPEQMASPLEVDHRADIYSLGVVIYELLTGELPLGRFPPPSQKAAVDPRLDEVVLRSLERDPQRRYQHVSDIRTAVDEVREKPVAEQIKEVAVLLNVTVMDMVGLAGIAFCLGILGLSLWWTENGLLLFALPFIGMLAEQFPWRSSARVLVGMLLGVSGITFGVLGMIWSPGMLIVLIVIATWFSTQVQGFLGHRRHGEDAQQQTASETLDLSPFEREIYQVLKQFADEAGYYLAPDLPAEGLQKARQRNAVPPDERILALLDFTGDKFEQTLLFGCRGIYAWGGVGQDEKVLLAIPYAEFPDRTFVSHGLVVYLGKDQFLAPDQDSSPTDCSTLANVLSALRKTILAQKKQPG